MPFCRLLTKIASEYRREKWYALLTTVIMTALRSAYLLADVQDYITLSLEYIAEEICRSAETKTRIQLCLLQVICVSNRGFSFFVLFLNPNIWRKVCTDDDWCKHWGLKLFVTAMKTESSDRCFWQFEGFLTVVFASWLHIVKRESGQNCMKLVLLNINLISWITVAFDSTRLGVCPL